MCFFVSLLFVILFSSFAVIVFNSDSSVIKKELIYRSSEIIPLKEIPISKNLPFLLFLASEIIGIIPGKSTGVFHGFIVIMRKTGYFLFKRTFHN